MLMPEAFLNYSGQLPEIDLDRSVVFLYYKHRTSVRIEADSRLKRMIPEGE